MRKTQIIKIYRGHINSVRSLLISKESYPHNKYTSMGGKNRIANMGKDGLKEGTTISLGGKDRANPVGK